jgi:RNA methyltransferase, TrmH family
MARSPASEQRQASRGQARESRPDTITSRENKWLKIFRAALRGTGPAADEPIAAEGPKLVEEGVRSGLEVEALLVSESGERELGPILHAAKESEAGISRSRILRTTDKLFATVAGTETPQGVAALFLQPQWGFQDVLRGASTLREAPPLVIVLAGIQDPGNVGAILRSAEAFGATGVVAARGTADPWSPKALRASAGSALRLPILRGMAIPVLMAQLKIENVKILAASGRGEPGSGSAQWDFRDRVAVFIGNEAAGLPSEVEHAADARISIPMSGGVESLNAAVAASVILYEAARQRRQEAS